jgi:hypothetical protein
MEEGPKTIDEVIDRMGGTGAVGRLLGIGPSAVSNWRAQGEIPRAWHLALYLEAERRGFQIPMRLFGVHDASAA